jgi:RecA/RadA recombinase
MAGKKSYKPETRPRLDDQEKSYLLAHILRLPDLFSTARNKLLPEYWYLGTEPGYRLIWLTALTMVEKFGTEALYNIEQAWSLLSTEAQAKMKADDKSYSPAIWDSVFSQDSPPGLLTWVYRDVLPGELTYKWGSDLLIRFMNERVVSDKLRRLLIDAGDDVITNIMPMFADLKNEAIQVSEINDSPVESGAPEGWVPTPLGKYPTGVTFIDTLLNGGHAAGETYGILGAFGSGKTTLALQLLAESAKYQQGQRDSDKDGLEIAGDCYYFHYECTSDEIRPRLWSYVGEIDRDKIEEFDVSKLTRRGGQMEPYEIERFKQTSSLVGLETMDGEFERLERALRHIRQNMWLIDMSGNPKSPKRGTGYVAEIADIIEEHQRKLTIKDGWKHKVSIIVIDYAGLCSKRYMKAMNYNESRLRHLVGDFGDECHGKLAVPFHTPVWIMHQLSGQANKRTFHTKQTHGDAAESASFAENLWFCFSLGTKDDVTGVVRFNVSKARRTKLGEPPILRINGPLSALVVAHGYVVDGTGKVVSEDVASNVHGSTTSGGHSSGKNGATSNGLPPKVNSGNDPNSAENFQ